MFDGAGLRAKFSSDVVASSADSFIERATALYHPTLQPGQKPAVAVALAPGVRPEGAPSDDELHRRMGLSPLTNPEREQALTTLFQEGGAGKAKVVDSPARGPAKLDLFDTVIRQDAGKGRHNLYVVKKGRSDKIIVVGGHHDKVREGHGTIDNWTGATMVANLYQALKDVDTEATYVFIGFAREEEGLLGSKHFVASLPQEVRKRVIGMVNLDTLAIDGNYTITNISTKAMVEWFRRVAKAVKIALGEYAIWGGDSDSTSFKRGGMEAISIAGASENVIFDIIHSDKDTMAAFSLPHYKSAFLLTLATLADMDLSARVPAAI